MKLRNALIFAAGLSAAASAASATVVDGAVTGGWSLGAGGTFQELDGNGSFDVGWNNFDSPNLYAFNENQHITLGADVQVDIGNTLKSGDKVASHYVFFDPPGIKTLQSQIGWVDFDTDILGIVTTTSKLAATDAMISNSINYLTPNLRGLEAATDTVWIDENNSKRLWVDWAASTPGDYVRVFTGQTDISTVPVPASAPLLMLAVAGIAGLRRRRKA